MFTWLSSLVQLLHWQTGLPYDYMRSVCVSRYGNSAFYNCVITASNGITQEFAVIWAVDGAHLA